MLCVQDRSPLFQEEPRMSLALIATADVPVGEGREVVANGRIFAVFNVDGEFRVLDGICPHSGGPLGKGTLNDGIVTCPWHGWQFETATGQHCLSDTICQPSYSVEVIDGQVCVRNEGDQPSGKN